MHISIHRLGFLPYDVTEIHRVRGVLLQVDIMFVNQKHPAVQGCQEKINDIGPSDLRTREDGRVVLG
jgi:hypothetical protein